jgi:hypothetical protein
MVPEDQIMTTATITPEFELESSDRALGPTMPQRAGRRLWAPMLAMALMAFPIALILGFVRAGAVSDGTDETTIAALEHLGPAFMFIGFATVLAAISFAIARILGVLRVGGGTVQATAGRRVQTLKMPFTGKVFIGLMLMAMMAILLAVVAHLVIGLGILGGDEALTADSAPLFAVLEGVRRIGTAMFLLAIAFGLGTIVEVLRFQAKRIGELPAEAPAAR